MIYSGKIEKNKNIVEYLKNKIFLIHKKHLQNNIIEFDNEFFEKNNKLNEKEILNSIENIEDYHKKICRALEQKQIKDDYSKNQAIDMLNNINMFKFLYYSNNNLSNLNVDEKIEHMKRDNYSMFVKSLISREYNIVNDTINLLKMIIVLTFSMYQILSKMLVLKIKIWNMIIILIIINVR